MGAATTGVTQPTRAPSGGSQRNEISSALAKMGGGKRRRSKRRRSSKRRSNKRRSNKRRSNKRRHNKKYVGGLVAPIVGGPTAAKLATAQNAGKENSALDNL